MLIQTCSKTLALNSIKSNSPLILDEKQEGVLCDRSQCQRLKSTSCNVVEFLRTCKRTASTHKMNCSEFLKHRRKGHSKCSSQLIYIHTSQYSTLQLFPPGQFPKTRLIGGVLCHHRQAWLLVSLQDWDKSS